MKISTRISAAVGDHPYFLPFISMIPIDFKLKFSPYTCKVRILSQ